MEGFLVILPVVIVIAAGWVLGRRMVTPEAFSQINRILYWVAMPSLLLRLIGGADMSAVADWNMLAVVYLSFFIAPLVPWVLGRMAGEPPMRTAGSLLMVIRSNTVFIGIPVVSMAVGERGLQVLSAYLAFTFAGYQVVSILWAQLILSGGLSWRAVRGTVSNLFRNPLVVATFTGIFLAVSGFNDFPAWMEETLKLLGNIGSGMALLSLGASLNLEGLAGMLPRTLRDVSLKLLFLPALTWVLFRFLPADPLVSGTVVLVAAMPVAVDCYILSQVLGMDSDHTAETITASTILSGLTLPFWVSVLSFSS